MAILEGTSDGSPLRLAIVVARFNRPITERLLEGAMAAAREHGVAEHNLDVAWVPGSFELSVAARALAESGRYRGIACLGAVIRGETAHFDFVAGEAARGIAQVAADYLLPVTFGVITADTLAQADARSGAGGGAVQHVGTAAGASRNMGRDAMLAAIEMATLLPSLEGRGR